MQVQQEVTQFARAVDWAYDKFTVPLWAGLIVLSAAPLPEWRAYALVPMACILLPLLCCEFTLFCHRRGIIRWCWETVRDFVNGTIVRLMLGVDYLRQSKPGQVCLWLALANLSIVAYYLYVNIDLFKLVRSFYLMLHTMVTALGDPVALLRSFQETLRTLSLNTAAEQTRAYVNMSMSAIDQGSAVILLPVLFVSACLIILAVAFYVVGHVWNGGTLWEWGHEVPTTPRARPQQRNGAEKVDAVKAQ